MMLPAGKNAMQNQVMKSRHRPEAVSDAARWLVTVHRHDGGRGQQRRIQRRAQRRVGAFVVMATMMASQSGLLGALVYWSHFSLMTRILLGAGAVFAVWATVFMIVEAVLAGRLAARIGAQRGEQTANGRSGDSGVVDGGVRPRHGDHRHPPAGESSNDATGDGGSDVEQVNPTTNDDRAADDGLQP
jgi:hypothetical protein